jgi:glycosyltransferase involved in cell wall biosynthesis
MPKVSVIMSVYKEPVDLIRRSTESILNQTFTDLELLVVVDWPANENAIEYFKNCSAKDNRVLYSVNEKNIGQGPSRNASIKKAKGKYIALQDADDVSVLDRLQKQVECLDSNEDVDVVGTGLIYHDLTTDKEIFRRSHNSVVSKEINQRMPCGHPSIMVKRNIFERYGYYDTQFIAFKGEQTFVEDYDLFLRWYIRGAQIRNLQEYLYIYSRDGTKIPKAKSMLISVVNIKKKYKSQLNYRLIDYFYLYAQSFLSLFPSKVITYIFYKLYS